MITIRQAEYEDIPRIMEFIDSRWKKGHIMGNDRTMFEFQHVRNGEVYYMIAEDDDPERTIYGAVGFMPMSYGEHPNVSMMMMMSQKNPEKRMLAGEMADKCWELHGISNEISPGVNSRYARAIMQLEPHRIGKLEHYYMLADRDDYVIAKICHRPEMTDSGHREDEVWLVRLTEPDLESDAGMEEVLAACNPYRSKEYLVHRYFHHPYYSYQAYGLERDGECRGILFAREIRCEGACLLKLVDYVGEDPLLGGAGLAFRELLKEGGYEYIDFYCYGIEEDILRRAGFTRLDEDDTNVIPLYFQPFERRNVDIYFNAAHKEGIHVFTGFGDQDRPNNAVPVSDRNP